MKNRNETTSIDSSCQRTFFITKERESQRLGTYIVCALQKLTCFSIMNNQYKIHLMNQFSQCFVT